MKRRNDGFTLIEIIISTAILVILAGFLTLSLTRYHRKAREAVYRAEAAHVCKAVELYLMDLDEKGEPLWYFTICIDLMNMDLSNPQNPLNPYLAGTVTEEAYISELDYSNSVDSFGGIEYRVDGYLISARVNGETEILSYP